MKFQTTGARKVNLSLGKLCGFLCVVLATQTLFFSYADAQTGWGNIQTNVPALKDVYKNDFTIGCLLSYPHVGFKTDPPVSGQGAVVDTNGGYLIKYHMNSMSPGNWMKPQNIINITTNANAYNNASTQQAKDSVDVHPIITLNGNIIAQFNWAKRQGFTFRGHTLVWHNQHPGTAFFRTGYAAGGARLTKEKMTERMRNFIKEVIRQIHNGWPGLLSAMDVVNEAVNENGNDRTTDSEWYVTFGDNSYIMKAFEFARQYTIEYGETQMKLYYNDYNTHTPAKADGIVRICGPIFRAGYLDGIGMQEHDNNSSPTAAQWITTYNKFDTICTEMSVTEFDVSTQSGTNTPSASVLATQARQYGQLFKCFVERSYKSGRGKIINVSKDGLNDERTFVTNQSSSLWTPQNQCKPSFYSAANVGINYNKLDSLITYVDSLDEGDYTPQLWTLISAAKTSAISARDKNYSNTDPADAGLENAVTNLQAALKNLSAPSQMPTLLFPLSNAEHVRADTLTLKWSSVDSASGYEFQLLTDVPFSPFSVLIDSTADTTYTVINLANPAKFYWRVRAYNFAGVAVFSAIDSFTTQEVLSVGNESVLPKEFALSQNYPNPFNPTTQIRFAVPVSGFVSLKVYNLLGQEVATLFEGVRQPGNYETTFEAKELSSGVYLYRLQAGSFVETKKLILLK